MKIATNLARALAAAAIVVCLTPTPRTGCVPSDPPERSYRIDQLDPVLARDAHKVVREAWVSFDVSSRSDARLKVLTAVTVFDAQGRDAGELILWYGHYSKIKNLDGRLLDANGKEIRDLEGKDTHDFSAVDGYSLAEDYRKRTAGMYGDRYPYTVEYSYEIAYNGHLAWPGWIKQDGEDAVEHSYFEITLPQGEDLRYWINRDTVTPRIINDSGRKTYIWEAANLPKLSDEMKAEDVEYRTCVVETAPTRFQLDDYPGEMTSWKSFGAWVGHLYTGRDQLPAAAAADVHRIVLPQDSPRTRATKLYKYMQERTRYVSIQLGIGGWQPFDATFVHEHGYGDCKALSNYMVSLLKEAGVAAYPVMIYSGAMDGLYQEDFPSAQFNHIIVCVPTGRDSLWLECTSQTIVAGHLGSSTENRFGVLLSPQGGEFVRTPASKSTDNEQRRKATVRLATDGTVTAAVATRFTGDQQDPFRFALANKSEEDRKKWLTDDLEISNASITAFALEGLTGTDPKVGLSVDLSVPKYASITGTRIFFLPNLMERKTYIPRDLKERKSPVRYSYPYRDVDSIVFALPKGYTVEAVPSPVDLRSSFGSFHSSSNVLGDTALVYTRILEIHQAEIPAPAYNEYRNFSKDIVKADRAQAVLVKQ